MTLDVVIASAADSKFFPLLRGMVLSVRRSPTIGDLRIVVQDLGLNEQDKAWLAEHDVATLKIGWDFDVLAANKVPEHFKALAWRPFLPKHCPPAEVYVWMDADAWVQDEQAVLLAIDGARQGLLAIVPEISRFYPSMYVLPHQVRSAELEIYRACFLPDVAAKLIAMPLNNGGFFAMAKDCPGWALYGETLGYMHTKTLSFYTEQCALNACIYARGLKTLPLPAHCNWMCHQALPAFDPERGRFLEPGPPYQDLWLVHLAGATKSGEHGLKTPSGGMVQRSLRYPE